MNLAFFGTSDRSIPLLEALKNSDFDLVLCITKEDTVIGRERKSKSTAVKEWSEANRVQYVTIEKLDSQSTAYIKNLILEKNIELCVVTDFSILIPEELLSAPKHGFVNVHFSLLPSYRGASPVQFAILNGDKKTGISYLLVTKKLDAGPIIFQSEFELSGNETSDSLYKLLFKKAADEICDVISKYISGKLKPVEQNENKATYTYSPTHPKSTLIFKEDAKINWGKTPEEIDRAVRAYNPWPIAWTTLGDLNSHYCGIKPDKDLSLKVKIFEPGMKKLQVEGKTILSWEEFENGYVVKS